MNLAKLAWLNQNNPAAALFFRIVETRNRGYKRFSLAEMMALATREKEVISPEDVEAFFEGLEEAQVGQFFRDNAKGHYFLWLERARDVAQNARSPHAAELCAQEMQDAPPPTPFVSHELKLRPDWTLTLSVPADFSASEAKRLRHFIKAICAMEE